VTTEAPDTVGTNVEHIPPDECLDLLSTMSIGRIAVASPGGPPLVVPVNYIVDDESVVFRSDPGTKLDLLRSLPVSFQVDLIDPFHRTGWSVLIQGVAVETVPVDVGLQPWAGGPKQHWVRITTGAITGRRLCLAELPFDSRGYL
jgi:hypothetical protein